MLWEATAELCSNAHTKWKDQNSDFHAVGSGGGKLPPVPYEDIIMAIVGATTLNTGIDLEGQFMCSIAELARVRHFIHWEVIIIFQINC